MAALDTADLASDFARLIDERPADGVFRVNRRVYTDGGVFAAEIERIFESGWVYVCHESQIPEAGDYAATTLGRQPVFVVRGSDGAIRGFVDACTHRGARLTHKRYGNVRSFVCRYHSWSFDLEGHCTGIMAEEAGWRTQSFDRSCYDLTPVGAVASHRGFVFASLAADVPTLAEHLGNAAAFLDIACEPEPQELEVVGPPVSYILRANWKLIHENSADSYHAPSVHRNYRQAIGRQIKQGGRAVTGGRFLRQGAALDNSQLQSGAYDLGDGHGLFWTEREEPENFPIWLRREALEREQPPGRVRWALGRGRQLTVFPNLAVNDLLKASSFRFYRPLAPDATEVTMCCLAPRGESPEQRRERLRHYETLFLPSSMLHSDDIAILELAQYANRAATSPWTDMTRGLAAASDDADSAARDLDIAPAKSSADSWDDTAMQALHRHWARVMEQGDDRAGV